MGRTRSELFFVVAGHVYAFVKALQGIGSPVERNMEHAGLSVLDYQDSVEIIYEPHFWQFIERTALSEGIDEFGLHVAEKTNLEDSGLEKLLVNPTTGWAALNTFCKLQNELAPHPHYWMQRDDHVSWFCRGTHLFEASSRDIELFSVSRIVTIVRLLTGLSFVPKVVRLQTRERGEIRRCPELADTRFEFGLPNTAIAIPHDILLRPVGEVLNTDYWVGKIRNILRQEFRIGAEARVNELAETLHFSPRTLQRKFSDQNVSDR